MANILFLRLEGPLQSWGERAQWSVRDTASEPTKSGIVGMLGCALGVSEDEGLKRLSQSVRIGVRCDRPGEPLVDYHTVGGGYTKPTLLQADGKPKKGRNDRPHTELTRRNYLSDASFLIAVQASPDMIQRLAEAMQDPTWPFYLGRKSCPPTRPVYDGVGDFATLEEALTSRPLTVHGDADEDARRVRAALECSPTARDAVRRRDEVGSRSRRTFLPRYSVDKLLDVPVHQEAE